MMKLRDIDRKLIEAVREKDLPLTKQLVLKEQGANVDSAIRTEENHHLGDQICNVLSIACMGSDKRNRAAYEIVEFLLAQGAKADTQLGGSLTSLMYASFYDSDIIKLLLAAGADKIINFTNEEGWTALMYAAKNDTAAVKILCDHGADLHAQNIHGQSALHYAVYNEIGVMRELLNRGANPNLPNDHGNSPLMVAAQCNFIDKTEFLKRNGGDMHLANNNGKTPQMLLDEHAQYLGNEEKKSVSRGLDI